MPTNTSIQPNVTLSSRKPTGVLPPGDEAGVALFGGCPSGSDANSQASALTFPTAADILNYHPAWSGEAVCPP
jgi:hypothetical protein